MRLLTTPSDTSCATCADCRYGHWTFRQCVDYECSNAIGDAGTLKWEPLPRTAPVPDAPPPSLPENPDDRNEYPMAEGLLDYFPNALAEVSRLSHQATLQHHPDAGMHWDRTKSLDHRNKIMRHLVDVHTVDDKGLDHWAMVCWRALAGYQEYLEAKHGLPPSRASRNRPENFGTR